MTGGLLQIISSGRQDIYLTTKPEITFFKKVFRRYTNFATEHILIKPEQPPDYNNNITFIINIGDCVGKCYIEVNLPNLYFNDSYITDQNYLNRKSTVLSNNHTQITKWTNYYNNLKGYVDIEIQLYRELYVLLLSENITITTLQNYVSSFNQNNKITKDLYKNKIDPVVYQSINITGYIMGIQKMITTDSNYDANIYISVSTIFININTMYQSMVSNLSYYNNKIVYYQNEIESLTSSNQINFNYSNYLGHNYFEYISLEIGGIEFTRYTNDMFHIHQMHSLKQSQMPNYNQMIGNVPSLNIFNTDTKGNTKLLIPLDFWFNKDTGSSLPLVAMQYSTISINVKISELKKIVNFENYEKMFNDIVNVSVETTQGFIPNNNLIYSSYSIDIVNKKINYVCSVINAELLRIVFPDLTEIEINLIITKNGSNDVIVSNQWVSFMLNIKNPIYNSLAPKVASYYPYINFNLYYSLIPKPDINLISEIVYLDDVERNLFANSKLEYVIENVYQDIFTINNPKSFDCELSFLNPSKELIWYLQPQLFLDGLTPYGQNLNLSFDSSSYFNNTMLSEQVLTFDKEEVLLKNIDNNYYINVLSYKYLNNILPDGLYYQSFCLYPEETQPSGTANLREIKGKLYKTVFNPNFLTEYQNYLNLLYGANSYSAINKNSITLKFISKSYDLFIVSKGKSKLLFSV